MNFVPIKYINFDNTTTLIISNMRIYFIINKSVRVQDDKNEYLK